MSTFFVFLDILGFKKIVENNDAKTLNSVVEKFLLDFENAIDTSRTIGDTQIRLDSLNFRIYSDSILIWTNDELFRTFGNLLYAVSFLVSHGLQHGFPLRGVLNYGELFICKKLENKFLSNEAIYGKALVEAYSLEGQIQCAGCILTPQAWKKICEIWSVVATSSKDPNAYFNRYPYLVWYPIPMKTEVRPGIAINWNFEMAWNKKAVITPETIENSFSAYGKGTESNPQKLVETLRFLKYTTELQKHCFWGPENEERCKKIPTPDNPHSDYYSMFLG